MTREELKEIIHAVIDRLAEPADGEAPQPACIFGDDPTPCDVTTEYAVGEEG